MQSEQLGPAPLSPWVVALVDGSVQAAHCDCVDGLDEACTHIAALLFTVEANVRAIDTGTVDDKEANWMMPSAEEKLLYRSISEIDVTPRGYKTGRRRQSMTTSVAASKRTIQKKSPTPTQMEIDDFYLPLHAPGAKCATLSLVEPYSDEFVPQAMRSTSTLTVSSCSGSSPSSSSGCTEEAVTSQDNVWCLCKGDENGRMIACDNQDCSIEWFHYSCVGIKRKPKGKWYCPDCNTKL